MLVAKSGWEVLTAGACSRTSTDSLAAATANGISTSVMRPTSTVTRSSWKSAKLGLAAAERVVAGREFDDAEVAVGAGEGGEALAGVGRLQGDLGAGDGGLLGIRGGAGDGSGERGLGDGDGSQQEHGERKQAEGAAQRHVDGPFIECGECGAATGHEAEEVIFAGVFYH